MDFSATTTSSTRLTMRSTFLRARQKVTHKGCFYLTMHHHMSSVHQMPSRLDTWSKVPFSAWLALAALVTCLTFSTGPKKGWSHEAGGPRMRHGQLPNDSPQDFYYPEDHATMPGWFKGMEQIIRERGLWPSDGRSLLAQCPDFKCEPGRTDCCCRRLLFNQPDFVAQKCHLQEVVEKRGHLCDFYPKYHCKLNFIEQYWGAAKLQYRSGPRPSTLEEMQRKMLDALDSIPLITIRRYVLHFTIFTARIDSFRVVDLQIVRRGTCTHMARACQAHRQHGPIVNIIAIGPFQQILLLR